MERRTQLGDGLPDVTRLGLATRGNNRLHPDDVARAVGRGVNYLNWCGRDDGLSRYVRESGDGRKSLVVAAQFKARKKDEADRELDRMRESLGGEPDILTFYYVESQEEWAAITAPGGVWDFLAARRRSSRSARIGLTTHQRRLAAGWTQEIADCGERRLDLVMIRYNAAHRGAEQDVFPVTDRRGTPAVCFTALRWGKLLHAAPGSRIDGDWAPSPPDCYRFCLSNPSANVVLTAPRAREELEDSLTLLDDWRPMNEDEMVRMKTHGDRVRATAGEFW